MSKYLCQPSPERRRRRKSTIEADEQVISDIVSPCLWTSGRTKGVTGKQVCGPLGPGGSCSPLKRHRNLCPSPRKPRLPYLVFANICHCLLMVSVTWQLSRGPGEAAVHRISSGPIDVRGTHQGYSARGLIGPSTEGKIPHAKWVLRDHCNSLR